MRSKQIMRDQFTLQNIVKLPSYIVSGLKFHSAGTIFTPKPTYSSLRVTRRCNSRCIMCKDWNKPTDARELTIEEIKMVYESPLFSLLQMIGFSGGEPTLRSDLTQIAETILDCCPRIGELRLVTNGLEPDLVVRRVCEFLELCKRKRIRRFSVSVSLDGYGPVHQAIRRVPQAFERASQTVRDLKEIQRKTPFVLNSTCVVQRANVESLVQLAQFARDLRLPLTFVPVRIGSSPLVDQTTSPEITADQLKRLKTIFDDQLEHYLTPSNFIFWQQYFAMKEGAKVKRGLPCHLLRHFAEIDTDGTMRVCVQRNSLVCGNILNEKPDKIWYSARVKDMLRRSEASICSRCTDCCDIETSLRKEFFFFAGFWLKERMRDLDFRNSKRLPR